MRFLQAYKAKRSANRHWDEREVGLTRWRRTRPQARGRAARPVGRVELKFAEADAERSGRLPREAFRAARACAAHDARQMANGRRVDAARRARASRPSPTSPRSEHVSLSLGYLGNVPSLNARSLLLDSAKVMSAVHKDTIKKAVLEQMPSSALEKHLLTLFKEAELRQSGGDESKCSGTLASVDVSKLLAEAKHLNLSRQQLLAVMSLKDQCLAEHVGARGRRRRRRRGRRGGRGGRRAGGSRPASRGGGARLSNF